MPELDAIEVIGEDIYAAEEADDTIEIDMSTAYNLNLDQQCPGCGGFYTCCVWQSTPNITKSWWYCEECKLLWEWRWIGKIE